MSVVDDVDEEADSVGQSAKRLFCAKENVVMLALTFACLIIASVALARVDTLHQRMDASVYSRRFCVQLRHTLVDAHDRPAMGMGQVALDASRQIVSWNIELAGVGNVTGIGVYGPMVLAASDGTPADAYGKAPPALALQGGYVSNNLVMGTVMYGRPREINTDGTLGSSLHPTSFTIGVPLDVGSKLLEIIRSPEEYFVSVLTAQHQQVGSLNGLFGAMC